MSQEYPNTSSQEANKTDRKGKLLTKRGEVVASLATIAAVASGAYLMGASTDAHFEGRQSVKITDQTTITDLAYEVDGAGEVNVPIDRINTEIVDRNPEILGDGRIDFEDMGETVDLPVSVK